MKSISGKELAKLLERRDWTLLRVQGSHHIYGKAGSNIRLSVPIHGNKPLKVRLLKHLLKMAEIREDALKGVLYSFRRAPTPHVAAGFDQP